MDSEIEEKLRLIACGDLEWCVDSHTLQPMLFDPIAKGLTPASERLTSWYWFINDRHDEFLRVDDNKRFWMEVKARHAA